MLKLVTVTDVAIATALVIARRAACSGRETITGIVVIFVVILSWESAKSEGADIGVGKDTGALRTWRTAIAVVATYLVASSFAGHIVGCAPAA